MSTLFIILSEKTLNFLPKNRWFLFVGKFFSGEIRTITKNNIHLIQNKSKYALCTSVPVNNSPSLGNIGQNKPKIYQNMPK